MSDAWRSYQGAPKPGEIICALEEVPDTGTYCLELNGFPLLLVRQNMIIRAFVNACPHQFLPLNYKGDKIMSADGRIILCTNHSAGFDALTGEGVEGLGVGSCLHSIPVTIDADQQVVVG